MERVEKPACRMGGELIDQLGMVGASPELSTLSFSIANLTVSTMCDEERLASILRRRYREFICPEQPGFTITITQSQDFPRCRFSTPEITFQNGQVILKSPGMLGRVNLVEQRGLLTLALEDPFNAVDYFIRVVVALLVLNSDGFLFHAAGIVRNERSYLFFGHSGSGKTTVSRLSIHDVVLNDDLVLVIREPKGWRVYATPFWNPSQVQPTPHSAPLAGIYRLVKDKQVFREEMSQARALAEMITSVPVVSQDIASSRKLLALLNQLYQDFPVYQLHFLPDESFWSAVIL